MLAGILGLSPLISGILSIIDKIVPDTKTRDQIKYELELYMATSDFQNAMGQQEIAKVDQASDSLWQAGWRPFIGWICGISFGWQFVLVPVIVFFCGLFGHKVPLPEFDMATMMTVLMGMLGLGGYRTYEKLQFRKYDVESTKNQGEDTTEDDIMAAYQLVKQAAKLGKNKITYSIYKDSYDSKFVQAFLKFGYEIQQLENGSYEISWNKGKFK